MSVRRFMVVGVVAIAAGAGGVTPAGASSSATTVLTVQVSSPFAGPGDVQVQDVNGNVLATCQGLNTPGTATCTVGVPAGSGVLVIAQPSNAGGFKNWTASCSPAPGPICHLLVGSHALQAVGHFGSSPPTPTAVATAVSVFGNTTGCSGFSPPVTVNGTGFPTSTPVTLSDDGHQVASGTTDGSGFAQLSYTANSEPGVYRNLVMGAAAVTATTDIYNEGSFCLDQQNGTGTGMVSFQVVGADLDADSTTGTVRFGTNPAVSAPTDANGVFTVTTPAYRCSAGSSKNLVIKDVRGAGSRSAYHGTTTFAITC